MRFLFWGAVALIAYAYVGYAAWLWVLSRWRIRPVAASPFAATVSIILVVRNEAARLERKLNNLLQLSFPADSAEIVVVSDGSTDGSAQILERFAAHSRIRIVLNSEARGKASGLNEAIKLATGEIAVFTDARQTIELDAVQRLMQNFGDPEVGCVSGELMLGDADSGESTQGMGAYWRVEKSIREMESVTGSVIGATGALYAVRRSLLVELPPETILDDVYIPMHVLQKGARVIFDPKARAWDVPDQGTEREFWRKVRTLRGNYQLLQISPWLLTDANPARFRFVSHKLTRLLVPFALLALLISSFVLTGTIYRIALAAQLGFYLLSALALIGPKRGPLAKAADVALTLVLLNTAAAVAFAQFISGRRAVWAR